MNNKNSFVLYSSFYKLGIKDLLTDEQAGKLFKAVFEYVINDIEVEMEPVVQMAFRFICNQLVLDDNKWVDIKMKRAEAGAKGGSASKDKQPEANVSKDKQPEANVSKDKQPEANVSKDKHNVDVDVECSNDLKEKIFTSVNIKKKSFDLEFSDSQNSDLEQNTKEFSSSEQTQEIALGASEQNQKVVSGKKSVAKSHAQLKKSFSEFVSMSQSEYDKLVLQYGADFTERCVEVLNNFKGSSGKKYKSDYFAILSWVADKVQKEQQNRASPVGTFQQNSAYQSKHYRETYAQEYKPADERSEQEIYAEMMEKYARFGLERPN